MTLFEELGVEYKEVDGILYPLLSVDEAEYNLTDIGKYGRMWIRYMEENKPSEYRHMARMGQLRKRAEAVNEEAYERLDNIEAAWLKKHMTGKKKTFMEQLYLRNQARAMAEEIVMHVVGVPVWEGAKRGLSKKVSKRNVFTPQTLSVILQDKLRAEASYGFECYFKEQLAEKKKGRNHDLSVTEYKVAQESRKLADIKQQNNEEQEKNTKLRSNNASISYQIATQEQRHSRNLDVIATDEDRLETVRSSINAAEKEYAKYADMITDKKNNLEQLSSKESELIERTKIAESVYDMFRQGGTDDVREKLIDVMYENQKLREENTTLKELLEKAYEFMKQFVIDGVNLLERFLESVGNCIRVSLT